MKVLVTTCEGNDFGRISTLPLDLPDSASIDDLKILLSRKEKIERCKLRLCVVLNGVKVRTTQVLLADGQPCHLYHLVDGSHVHMEVLGGRDTGSEELTKGKLFAKLGISSATLGDGRLHTHLETIIQKCKSGRLDAFMEAVEMCEEADPGLEDDFEHIADQANAEGWTCYHFAAIQGFHRIVGFLNSKGFNPNRESKDGWTPLQLASYHGKVETVRELLKHPNIQINRVTWRGTALHQACHSNSESIVQLLLEAGACMTLEDSKGRIPLQVASTLSIIEMIPRYMGERQLQSITQETVDNAAQGIPPPFCGEVHYVAPLRINERGVYLVLDAGAWELNRYNSQKDFLDNGPEAERVPLIDIQAVTQVEGPVGSKGRTAFLVEFRGGKSKYICHHAELAQEWVERIHAAVEYCQVHTAVNTLGRPSSFTFRAIKGSGSESCDEESKEMKRTVNSTGVAEDEMVLSSSDLRQIEEHVSFRSFHILEELGSGSFGKVYKVQKITDNHIYAMKSLSKQYLSRNRQLKYAISECRILKGLNHPFVIRLFHAFQTPRNLYMVLEYCPNGDLAAHLTERGTFSESDARFYLAEILLAIEYLHSQDIVYRDLKPENILLDHRGHVRLADFGLAKEGISNGNLSKTFCGSPAYFAPEVLTRRGAGKPADVYGLGVILYELLTGSPPHYSEDTRQLLNNIQKQTRLNFPKHLTEEAKDLLRGVLNRDATKRPTATQLKAHPFFSKMDWTHLRQQKVQPPSLGTEWQQGDFTDEENWDNSHPCKIDVDYSEAVTMEECVLDFD